MPPVARGDGGDSVLSKTGSGRRCGFPTKTNTKGCSGDVFVEDKGIVRKNDVVGDHNKRGCSPDTSVLTSFSGSVFANDLNIGRIGDEYTSDNIITSGSGTVFAD